MNDSFHRVLLGLALPVVPVVAQQPAEDPPEVREPLVVTVSAAAIERGESSTAVMVISREDVEDSHADSLGDLLSNVPHIHVSRGGHPGSLTTATIRGGDPNFTLVLIDGIPANDPTNILGGSYDLSALSLDNVERVEIVRGPMSSIYGSAASAGVINVITRRSGQAPGLRVEAMLGNRFGTGRFRVGGSRRIGSTSVSASGSFLALEGTPEGVESKLGAFSASAETRLTPERSVEWLFRFQRADAHVFPENGGGPEHSVLRTLKDSRVEETLGRVGYTDQLTGDWALGLSWDIYDVDRVESTPPILDRQPPSSASLPAIDSDTRFTRNRVRATNTWTSGSAWTTHFGFSFEEERGTTLGTIAGSIPADFQLTRTTLAATGEAGYRLGWLNLDFNLRMDKINGFGTEISPGIGLVMPIAGDRARLRASWATAFKAPSFYAIGNPLVGNPGLRPETTRGFDVGIEDVRLAVPVPVSLSLTWFRNTYRDLIDFSPALFRLVNRSEARTAGLEAAASVEVSSRIQISGHATYLDWSLGGGATEPLRDRPQWRGGARVRYEPFPNARLRWDTTWVGPRFDFQIPVPSREQVGGYSRTDVSLTFAPGAVELFARIENLFDRAYHEFIGFPDPGFRLRVGASFDVD